MIVGSFSHYFGCISHLWLNHLRGALVCLTRAPHRDGTLMWRKIALDWESPGSRVHIITGWVWEEAETGCLSTPNFWELWLSTRKEKVGKGIRWRKSICLCLRVSRWCKLAAETIIWYKDGELFHHQKERLFICKETLWSPFFSVSSHILSLDLLFLLLHWFTSSCFQPL